jgi:hypothetical protein
MALNTQVLLIGGGVAACLLALIWRTLARHFETSRLNRGLCRAEEPVDRARAGNELVALGLGRSALLILRAMANENDDRVRLSVALAVAKRQWEPAGARRVRSVRKWASEELEIQQRPVTVFGPAVTRLADMGGPRPDQVSAAGTNGHGSVPAPAPSGSEPSTVPSPVVTVNEPAPPAATNGATADRDPIRWVAPSADEPNGP